MALDDIYCGTALHDSDWPRAAPAGADKAIRHAPPSRSAAPASLVLFVGTPPSNRLCDVLAHDGMRSLWLAGPAQALRAARLARFDALVIDAAQLGSRAATWLAELRAQLGCPLLVVAEQADEIDEIDEIVTLELGADGYLARPLGARRLRAHLSAMMRWRGGARAAVAADVPFALEAAAGCRLDRVANRLTVDGRAIAITDRQGALLQCLLEARGRIVPRKSLGAALPHGEALSARSVDVYVHRLRQRLQEAGLQARLCIESVRGRGYRLEPTQ